MDLLSLCQRITTDSSCLLPENHKLGTRLVCPEYSKAAQEVKTYPLLSHDRIFALCWNFDAPYTLHTTMNPSPQKFCYKHTFKAQEQTQLHTHDYIELAYIVEGEFHQKISEKEIIFQKGELCLIDRNCLHQDYLENNSAVILFLGIDNTMFGEIMNESVTTQKFIAFLQSALDKQKSTQQYLHFRPGAGASAQLELLLTQLLKELYENEIGSTYICKGLLLRIFRILSTQYEFSLTKEQQKTMNWIVFQEICDYIYAHSATVTIQELMNVFHFQEDYFNRLIKKKTGMTYSAYVQNIRLQKAKRLLTTTDKSVSEIAEIAGYNNKGYFYKIFQEKYNMTPKEFRKQN